MGTRENFTQAVRWEIAKRAGFLCSHPNCGAFTVGPKKNSSGSVNVGVAAHICAASVGGPRYDEKQSTLERTAESNGIWLCQTHAKLIDDDIEQYTTEILKEWKVLSEESVGRMVGVPVRLEGLQESDIGAKTIYRFANEIVKNEKQAIDIGSSGFEDVVSFSGVDVLPILAYIEAFTIGLGIKNARVDSHAICSIADGLRLEFPDIDGSKGVNIYKVASLFLVVFISNKPVHETSSAIAGLDSRIAESDLNVIIAFDMVCNLLGISELSRERYVSILDSLHHITSSGDYKIVAVLLESLRNEALLVNKSSV